MKLAAAFFNLGSARVSRAGCGVSPQLSFLLLRQGMRVRFRKVRDGGTPSPARETRALPRTTSTLAHN